jgi:BolA protein
VSVDRAERIKSLIAGALGPAEVMVRDDSALHAGHAGARGGAGHYAVHVVSPRFLGLSTIQRHRLVYRAVSELMPAAIHALSIEALAPGERPPHQP